jgi:hypothetical protein
MLSEAYTQVQEGLFSRAKARVAGVVGAGKDAIARGKGQVQKAAGQLATAAGATTAGAEIQAAGQGKIDAGQGSGVAEKQKSIKNSIVKGVIADLEKLGLQGAEELKAEIQMELNKIFDEYFKINANPENYDAQGNELA